MPDILVRYGKIFREAFMAQALNYSLRDYEGLNILVISGDLT